MLNTKLLVCMHIFEVFCSVGEGYIELDYYRVLPSRIRARAADKSYYADDLTNRVHNVYAIVPFKANT